jgi:hypothetical protein
LLGLTRGGERAAGIDGVECIDPRIDFPDVFQQCARDLDGR